MGKPNPVLRVRKEFLQEVRSQLTLDTEQELVWRVECERCWDRGMGMYQDLQVKIKMTCF